MFNEQDLLAMFAIPNDVPIVGYLRVSTDEQKNDNQKLAIESWAFNKNISKDRFIWIDAEISSRKSEGERRLDEVFNALGTNGIFVATEISRLGRSTAEVTTMIEQRLKIGNRLIFINQNLDLNPRGPISYMNAFIVNVFASVAQLERDLISQRTKMGLKAAVEIRGKTLGRPKGKYTSMYDDYKDEIKKYLIAGIPVNSIIKLLKTEHFSTSNAKKMRGSQRSLSYYIKKHKIMDELWKERNKINK